LLARVRAAKAGDRRPNDEPTNQIRSLDKRVARIRGGLFRQNSRVRYAYPGYFANNSPAGQAPAGLGGFSLD